MRFVRIGGGIHTLLLPSGNCLMRILHRSSSLLRRSNIAASLVLSSSKLSSLRILDIFAACGYGEQTDPLPDREARKPGRPYGSH